MWADGPRPTRNDDGATSTTNQISTLRSPAPHKYHPPVNGQKKIQEFANRQRTLRQVNIVRGSTHLTLVVISAHILTLLPFELFGEASRWHSGHVPPMQCVRLFVYAAHFIQSVQKTQQLPTTTPQLPTHNYPAHPIIIG